jgi:hypothetical protein
MEYIKSQKKTVNFCCVTGTDIEKIRRASIPLRGDAPKLAGRGGCW